MKVKETNIIWYIYIYILEYSYAFKYNKRSHSQWSDKAIKLYWIKFDYKEDFLTLGFIFNSCKGERVCLITVQII